MPSSGIPAGTRAESSLHIRNPSRRAGWRAASGDGLPGTLSRWQAGFDEHMCRVRDDDLSAENLRDYRSGGPPLVGATERHGHPAILVSPNFRSLPWTARAAAVRQALLVPLALQLG